jgi:hypothetical protein
MGHIRTPQADSDLDDIWYYVALRSGSVEIADRLSIPSPTDFTYSPGTLTLVVLVMRTFGRTTQFPRSRLHNHLPGA